MNNDNTQKIDESILKDIFDNGRVGYWDWNIPSGDNYMSPSLKMMFGYEEGEIENTREAMNRLIFDEDKHAALDKFNAHVTSRGKIPFECDIRNHHKDGSVVWVLSRGKVIEWDEKGNPVRVVGCNIDITGQKLGEEHQRSIAANLQAVMGATNDLIASYDSDLRLIFFNEAYRAFFRIQFNVEIS
ncbi:MAG TPA: PAS domain-containing protein, partial [Spirochaetota bacterium]|nr:PAS domain-containing protein [Spirochaetota bacterium]